MAVVPDSDDKEQIMPFMTSQVASILVATVISASTLGLSVTPPPAAFAAPVAAQVQTIETVKPKNKVPSEVAAVESAKAQLTAATEALKAAQARIPAATNAQKVATKELKVADTNYEAGKKALAAANERSKSLANAQNSRAFDKKTIDAAAAKVGTFPHLYCRVLLVYGINCLVLQPIIPLTTCCGSFLALKIQLKQQITSNRLQPDWTLPS